MFIALEGIDGSGKSTQAKLLQQYFQVQKKQVYLTAQPTNHTIGKMIRSAFKGDIKLEECTIAALFVADRLEHITNKEDGILQMLQNNIVVVCDRYYFSSYAYHSVHVNMDWVIASNAMAASICKPTINIFIDVEPKLAMQRINANRASVELYETLDNLQKVRENYLVSFEKLSHTEKIIFVNGNQKPETIFQEIINIVKLL